MHRTRNTNKYENSPINVRETTVKTILKRFCPSKKLCIVLETPTSTIIFLSMREKRQLNCYTSNYWVLIITQTIPPAQVKYNSTEFVKKTSKFRIYPTSVKLLIGGKDVNLWVSKYECV